MYTVGEWIGDTNDAYVIAERIPLAVAQALLNITPSHLKRFIVDEKDGRYVCDQREVNG